jgi:hypothetical protein
MAPTLPTTILIRAVTINNHWILDSNSAIKGIFIRVINKVITAILGTIAKNIVTTVGAPS